MPDARPRPNPKSHSNSNSLGQCVSHVLDRSRMCLIWGSGTLLLFSKSLPVKHPLYTLLYPTPPGLQQKQLLFPVVSWAWACFGLRVGFGFGFGFCFLGGFFFFSDSTAFVVDDDKDRNRMTRSCSPKQAPVTQFSGLFQPAALTPLAKWKWKWNVLGHK